MLSLRKWIVRSPFSLKKSNQMGPYVIVLILAQIDQFCFQCAPRAKKNSSSLVYSPKSTKIFKIHSPSLILKLSSKVGEI